MKAPAQARGDFRIFIRLTARRAMRVGVITSGLHFPAQTRGGDRIRLMLPRTPVRGHYLINPSVSQISSARIRHPSFLSDLQVPALPAPPQPVSWAA